MTPSNPVKISNNVMEQTVTKIACSITQLNNFTNELAITAIIAIGINKKTTLINTPYSYLGRTVKQNPCNNYSTKMLGFIRYLYTT
jgi:hypothetical protein